MKIKKDEMNSRGLDKYFFEDHSHEKCSIQKSSLATENAIWLGVDNPVPIFIGKSEKDEPIGWVKYPMPNDVHIFSRMQLTQDQVASLLPMLQDFVETGTLHDIPKDEQNIFIETQDLIEKIYENNAAGGELHIVLDDFNLSEDDIIFCINSTIPNEKDPKMRKIYLKCALNLLKMSFAGRCRIIGVTEYNIKINQHFKEMYVDSEKITNQEAADEVADMMQD